METLGLNTWGQVFNESLLSLWAGFVQFVPNFIVAIVFFVIGWVLGGIIAKALEQVFSALKIDNLLRSIGVDGFFRRAGMNLNSGYFIGQVVKWFVIVVFLIPSLDLVGLNSIKDFLQYDVLSFLPRVIVAALILIISTIVAEVISKAVSASARTMNLTSANMLGTIAKYAIWIFAFIIALGQLGVADYYMSVLFTGIIAMVSIGGALAFGLGGRDAAAKFIAKVSEEVSHRE
ncbi:MAG: Conserved TM helix repeat-containing protein [Parcubacteria group bacterium GW2011_GWC1_35_8]|nr:MAG: Conserved TM helix repeat-containing protein [Parcubacteria group bacterium GW2011_GWC1_35_8]